PAGYETIRFIGLFGNVSAFAVEIADKAKHPPIAAAKTAPRVKRPNTKRPAGRELRVVMIIVSPFLYERTQDVRFSRIEDGKLSQALFLLIPLAITIILKYGIAIR